MQPRETIIPLANFVQRYNKSGADADSLVKTFLDGQVPSAHHFPLATKYIAKKYQERKAEAPFVGVLDTLLERALIKASTYGYKNWMSDVNEKREMINVLMRLYGCVPTDAASNGRITLFHRAAFYQFTHSGACSYRASYAALTLFKILQGSALKVALQSAPTVDQFIVLIGNKKEGYYVYDPLTNPTLVFDHEFYKKNILTTFLPVVNKASVTVNLLLTQELSDAYDKQYPIISEEFTKLLKSSEQSVDILLNDPVFVIALTQNKIAADQMQPLTAQAIKSAMELVSWRLVSCNVSRPKSPDNLL